MQHTKLWYVVYFLIPYVIYVRVVVVVSFGALVWESKNTNTAPYLE